MRPPTRSRNESDARQVDAEVSDLLARRTETIRDTKRDAKGR
jgi:hypothetical protein